MKVVISNGHYKFILGPAAAEASRRGTLAAFLTGGYPTARIKRWISALGIASIRGVRRLLEREEAIPESYIHTFWISEFMVQVNGLLRHPQWLSNALMRLYAVQAAFSLGKISASIYHYRGGYGHESVKAARDNRMITLCDYSLAHGSVLEYLITHEGRFPPRDTALPVSKMWKYIVDDANRADHIVANSDFVRETFLHQGWDPARVHVIYTGVDDTFLELIPQRKYSAPGEPVRLMFAGLFGPRKGGALLIAALQQISDLPWKLEIIGDIDPGLAKKYSQFLSDPRVTLTPTVPRNELTNSMSGADVFIFPSLAEGSARVVFMALACGCYVITTPNSGSIVENQVHGAVVPPWDAGKLEAAIRTALTSPLNIPIIGRKNAELVRKSYTQYHYGEHLHELYERISQDMR